MASALPLQDEQSHQQLGNQVEQVQDLESDGAC